jgi:hypothetical protein
MSMMDVVASKVLLVLIGMLALVSASAADLPMPISNNAVAALAVAGAGDTKAVDYYSWQPLAPMPGPARYRAAAAADAERKLIIFAAGAARAYNYNGIGYDGVPAKPLQSVVSFDLSAGAWRCHHPLAVASMDHRALLLAAQSGELIRIGGMLARQQVSAAWLQQPLPEFTDCDHVDH